MNIFCCSYRSRNVREPVVNRPLTEQSRISIIGHIITTWKRTRNSMDVYVSIAVSRWKAYLLLPIIF